MTPSITPTNCIAGYVSKNTFTALSPGYSSPETIVLDSNNEYGYVLGLGSSGSAAHSIINRIRLSDNTIVPFSNNASEILIFNTTGQATDITLGPMVIDSTDTYLYVLSPFSIYKISIATGITTNVFIHHLDSLLET